MKKFSLLTMIVCTIFLLSSCATMYRGTTGSSKEIIVRTDPAGANVSCGNQSITAPGVLYLAKNRSHKIIVTMPGYKTINIDVISKTRKGALGSSFLSNTGAWGWWTLGIGTAIGMITDATTGSLKDINIEGVYLQLTPGEGTISMDASELIPPK